MGWFKQEHYDDIYARARAALKERNPEAVARYSGVRWVPDPESPQFELEFLKRRYIVSHPEYEVASPDGDFKTETAILLLHYLDTADGRFISNHWVTYRDLPGVESYYPVFLGRVANRLLKRFGDRPDRLRKLLIELDGQELDLGGVLSMQISLFPMVPVGFVLHAGEEELPPSLTVMFDASVVGFLPLEDIIIACERLVGRLLARNKELDQAE